MAFKIMPELLRIQLYAGELRHKQKKSRAETHARLDDIPKVNWK